MREDSGERPLRAGLHHPQIRIDGVRKRKGIGALPTVDARHGDDDAEQQAEPQACQDEPSELMLDIAPGQVHWDASLAITAWRPILSPTAASSTISAPSGTPPVISDRPSSVRCPSVTVRCWRRPFSNVHAVACCLWIFVNDFSFDKPRGRERRHGDQHLGLLADVKCVRRRFRIGHKPGVPH